VTGRLNYAASKRVTLLRRIDDQQTVGTRVIVLAKECAAGADGSRVALDVAVPDADGRLSKARFAEEIGGVVRRVEEATGHLRAEEEDAVP